MKQIKVYTTNYCSYCVSAKRLLEKAGLTFEEIRLDDKPELRQKLSQENAGYRTVPMIFIDGTFIGGFNELAALQRDGKLA